MAAVVKEAVRRLIGGVEHWVYPDGRALACVMGGEPIAATVEEIEARMTEIRGRLTEIDNEHSGQALAEEARSEWNELNEELDRNEELLQELRARRARVEAISDNPESRESGAGFHTQRPGVARGEDIYDLTSIRMSVSSPEEANRELRDRASRSIEQSSFPHERADREQVQRHVERLIEQVHTPSEDPGAFARHLLQTGSPAYRRAFGKALAGAPLTTEESRALAVGTGSEGGFAVPYQLDPTIIPTSNHSVNPYRAISRVETIAGTNEWRGVTSGGVTATRRAEAAEAADNAPTLAQPTINVSRVDAFIPFSIEVGQDWGGLQAEMARLLQDAKDDEEASSFTTGDGVAPNPQGVLVGATNVVTTAGTGLFAVADVYATEEALPPRFRPLAMWVANRAIYNKVRQFDTQGGATLWTENLQRGLANQVPTPGGTGYNLLGYPAHEASAMDSSPATNDLIAVLGDFRYYCIVERIGMQLDLIPHLFGANRRPTGQRGLFAYWRNNAKVLSPAAFRVTKVK